MANRSADGRFAPGGGSHNPGGRSRFENAANKRCQEALSSSIEKLISLTDDDDPQVRLKAIGMILDRGLGRPQVRKDIDVSGRVEHDIGGSYLAALKQLSRKARDDRDDRGERMKDVTPKQGSITPLAIESADSNKLAYSERRRAKGD